MDLEQYIAAVNAPLAVSIESSAKVPETAILLILGAIVVVALSVWRRRQVAGRDPLRSLAPPAGPLRLARKLWMRSTTD